MGRLTWFLAPSVAVVIVLMTAVVMRDYERRTLGKTKDRKGRCWATILRILKFTLLWIFLTMAMAGTGVTQMSFQKRRYSYHTGPIFLRRFRLYVLSKT